MGGIDPITGLPTEIGAFQNIAKESQTITVKTEKKKFRKIYTVIEGIDDKEIDMKTLSKKFKSAFACGGTSKDGVIELQGEHLKGVKQLLIKEGFSPENIRIEQG